MSLSLCSVLTQGVALWMDCPASLSRLRMLPPPPTCWIL